MYQRVSATMYHLCLGSEGGFLVGSIPVGSIPVGSIPVGNIPTREGPRYSLVLDNRGSEHHLPYSTWGAFIPCAEVTKV